MSFVKNITLLIFLLCKCTMLATNYTDQVHEIKTFDIVFSKNNTAFLLKELTIPLSISMIGGIMSLGFNFLTTTAIQKILAKYPNVSFLKNLIYLKYLFLWPGASDLVKKIYTIYFHLQEPLHFSSHVIYLPHVINIPDIALERKHYFIVKDTIPLFIHGGGDLRNIVSSILGLFYFPIPAKDYYKEICIDELLNQHELQWGSMQPKQYPLVRNGTISPYLFRKKIAEATKYIQHYVYTSKKPVIIAHSMGGIMTIESLYNLCHNEDFLRNAAHKPFLLLTDATPYKKSTILKLEFILNALPQLKFISIIKFNDIIANIDPFSKEQVSDFFPYKLYWKLKKHNSAIAKRFLITSPWKVNAKNILTPYSHYETQYISDLLEYLGHNTHTEPFHFIY